MPRKVPKKTVNAKVSALKKTVRRSKAIVKRTPTVYASIEPNCDTSTRNTPIQRKRASSIPQSDAFQHIDNVQLPYKINTSIDNKNFISAREPIERAYKAYHGFSIVTNTIELMVDFATTGVYLKGGNKQSRDFFKAWLKFIKVRSLQEQFFREYYRSSNVILYRLMGKLQEEDVRSFVNAYGTKANRIQELPVRYILLNPIDIVADGQLNFSNSKYYKTLNGYEIERLSNPQTEQEKALAKKILPEIKNNGSKVTQEVLLPLNVTDIVTVFYRKQDYEPFGVPYIYPVLKDLNWKEELKLIDRAITRVVQQVILLVTAGAKPDEGGINENALAALNNILQNESVGKIIVADYTTEAKFVIPQVGDILDPKKYEVVNQDIKEGLNSVLLGNEKFSNTQSKIKTFINRLEKGQDAFLEEFLQPEIDEIGDQLNFKSIPTVYCKKIKLDDSIQQQKIYTQMAQLGMLTPEETFKAIEEGIIPDGQQALENQKTYKEQRDEGYWLPLVGGSDRQSEEDGRPEGTNGPKSFDTKIPQGDNASISLKSIVESTKKISSFVNYAKELYKNGEDIAEIVMANENPRWWKRKLKSYLKEPVGKNPNREKEIDSIAVKNGLSNLEAIIIYHATKN